MRPAIPGGGEALRIRKSAGARGREHDTAPYVERLLWSAGLARVAGVDEVGMGPLAGPVVAAAVMFAADTPPLRGIADSKLLPAPAREEAARAIHAVAIGVGPLSGGRPASSSNRMMPTA